MITHLVFSYILHVLAEFKLPSKCQNFVTVPGSLFGVKSRKFQKIRQDSFSDLDLDLIVSTSDTSDTFSYAMFF